MRFFFGFLNIGNYFTALKQGLELNKSHAELFIEEDKYNLLENNNIFSKLLILFTNYSKKNKFIKFPFLFCKLLTKLILFIYSLFKFDVYVFTGFNSFFYFWELLILKFFKKKIVIIFFGSDARHPFLSNLDNNFNINKKLLELKNIKSKIYRIEKYADIIINHTATSHLFKKKFIPFLYIGLPIHNLDQNYNNFSNSKVIDKDFNKNILLLHFPSNKAAKGTSLIIKAVNELKKDFKKEKIRVNIKTKILFNKSNKEVLRYINKSDLIINELYSDVFLSYADIEATLLNKVSLKFGYYVKGIKKDNPFLKFPRKIIYYYPENLKKELRNYILNDKKRKSFISLKNFIINNWSPDKVAKKFIDLVNNYNKKKFTKIYTFPRNINYLYGSGVEKKNIHKNFNLYLKNNKINNLYFHKKFNDNLKRNLI
jgi:hypothetical protein